MVDTEANTEDCTGCKLIRCCTLLGIGAYLAHYARQQKTNFNRVGMMSMASVVFTLGLAKVYQSFIASPTNGSKQS